MAGRSCSDAMTETPRLPATSGSKIDVKMLELLACPVSKGPLRWAPETNELVSRVARLAYPVRDGIPIMLPSEARRLDDGED